PAIYSFTPNLWLPGSAFTIKLPVVECNTGFLAQSHIFQDMTEEMRANPHYYDHPLLSSLYSEREVEKTVLESAILTDAKTGEPIEHVSLKFSETTNPETKEKLTEFNHIEVQGRIPEVPNVAATAASGGQRAMFYFRIGNIRNEAEWRNWFALGNESCV